MKNKLLAAAALGALLSAPAHAQLIIQPVFNAAPAPVYAEPAPLYVAPYPRYYDPYHRRHDWEYWREHRHHDEHWEHERR